MDYVLICAVCERKREVDQVIFKNLVDKRVIEVVDSPKVDAVEFCEQDKDFSIFL